MRSHCTCAKIYVCTVLVTISTYKFIHCTYCSAISHKQIVCINECGYGGLIDKSIDVKG